MFKELDQMKHEDNPQRGMGRITLLVFSAIGAALLFAGYQILPFYYYYYELVNQMEAVIKVAGLENDRVIRNKLAYHIKKLQIPAEIEDLKIAREGTRMRISLKYEEVFYVRWKGKNYDLKVFPFVAEAEGQF